MKDFGQESVQVAISETLFFCPFFFFARLTFNIFLSKRKREKPEIIVRFTGTALSAAQALPISR